MFTIKTRQGSAKQENIVYNKDEVINGNRKRKQNIIYCKDELIIRKQKNNVFYKDEVIIRKQENIVYCKDDIKKETEIFDLFV